MTIADELVTMANDYISGRMKLAPIHRFILDHVDESLELDESATAEALLFGFIQVRLAEMDDGLEEADVRKEITEYLSEHGLLRPSAARRATG
ncbi:MAG: hypothetical protein WEB52_09985 [Dehalococcoidia bacterium]